MELFCRLFVQLKTTWDAMEGFLLEERYLVLQPEFVFMDAETKDFFFLYYPEEPEEDPVHLLQGLIPSARAFAMVPASAPEPAQDLV